MDDILQKICAQTLKDLKVRQEQVPLEIIKERAGKADTTRGFHKAIKSKTDKGEVALICEVKKASPSKGLIREDFDPAHIAKEYQDGGAACLSVLTDVPFFQGHMDYLIQARGACNLPVLRKDFMLEPYQVYEARAIGADCILLIVAALDDETMKVLFDLAHDLNMDVLIEVHDEPELDRALKLNPELLGVNNRNLKTLEVDIQTSHILSKQMQGTNSILISESGIYSKDDIENLQKSGFYTFLIGESLMRQSDIASATQELLR